MLSYYPAKMLMSSFFDVVNLCSVMCGHNLVLFIVYFFSVFIGVDLLPDRFRLQVSSLHDPWRGK